MNQICSSLTNYIYECRALVKGQLQSFWIITDTLIMTCYNYKGVFCLFTHLRRPRSPPKFNKFFLLPTQTPPQNPFITFWVMLLADKQTHKLTNTTEHITSFVEEVITQWPLLEVCENKDANVTGKLDATFNGSLTHYFAKFKENVTWVSI